jgi:hypothetical protein
VVLAFLRIHSSLILGKLPENVGLLLTAFMLVWVCGVASFYFFGTAFKNGSPEPTATQTEPLEDHGKTVYVTPTDKRRVHALQLVSWVGVL